jgi:nitrite reductase/ring-hydroxylating ferredoxin subunit
MSTSVKVAKPHDLAEGGIVAVLVGDTEILLTQVQGRYYAIQMCKDLPCMAATGLSAPPAWVGSP